MLPSPHLYPRTPLILGHRGASAHAPENTLAAFRRALELGADGIELDVTLSADEVPVVIHDDSLDRTTDGRGPVHSRTLAELQKLDAGRWWGPEFREERLPTLAAVFEAFGARPVYNVELKRDPSHGRVLARRVVDLVQQFRLAGRVIVSSFDFDNLRRVKALAAQLPLGLLYVPPDVLRMAQALLGPGFPAQAHHPYYRLLNRPMVNWYHRRGWRVNTWTVNDEADLRRMLSLGVDGLITNYPDRGVRLRG